MNRRGRVSLTIAIILMVLSLACLTFGVLSGIDNVLNPSFNRVLDNMGLILSIAPGRWGLFQFGLLLCLLSSLIFAFRLRKPYSMFLPVALVIIYFTGAIAFRLWKGIDQPELYMQFFDSTKKILLLVLLIIEVAITFVLMFLTSNLDARWRRKDEETKRRLEEEGLYFRKEALEREKAVARQRKDNELDEKRRQRNQREYDEEKERAIKIEERKEKKRKERADKDYDKLKEREELRKENKEEKERNKREKERNKALEKLDSEAENKKRKEEKMLRKQRKEEQKREKEEKKRAEREKEEAYPEEDKAYSYRRPDEPIEFPDFIESPHFRPFTEKKAETKGSDNGKKSNQFESSAFMDSVKEGMEKEKKEPSPEKKEYPDVHQKKFTSGGMLEATIEMMNSFDQSEEAPTDKKEFSFSRDQSVRNDFVSQNTENRGSSSSSFAPSNLSPNHPRYKMFENLQNGRYQSDERVEEEKKEKPNSGPAPSNLSPNHPRYKMFESLERNDTSKEYTVSHFPTKPFEPDEPSDDIKIYKKEEVDRIKEQSEPIRQTPVSPVKEAINKSTLSESAKENLNSIFKDAGKESETEKVETPPARSSYPQEKREYDSSIENMVGVSHLRSTIELGYQGILERSKKKYSPPFIDFLKEYPRANSEIDEATIERGKIIEETYAQQKTDVQVENIVKGPTVTMYELHIGEGTLISRITSRENELNYALGGKSVRILAPIRGKKAVGIEVPNDTSSIVGFKDLIRNLRNDPKASSYRIPMVLGKTITGESVVIDIAKMPHMIIAGTTGSGKSVAINSFISTIIYQKSPKEVRLILVDPKVVELSVYNGIPHLLTPVITESKKVVKALNYLVDEMERRYTMLSNYGVRNIDGYNEKVEREHLESEKMPYIVLIIDEMADLMASVGKEIELQIGRLAAKARAAGIHLILATQRPTTDVITGTIKANLPGRIAFAVSSAVNSRVILDEVGAEALLGKGDMLLLDPSNAIAGLRRIQGAFLSDEEVDQVSRYAKEHAGELDQLDEDIFMDDEQKGGDEDVDLDDDDSDETCYERAKMLVIQEKKASASFLQRKMRIGFNKASRIIDILEERGVIGPQNGAKPREILKSE